MNENEYSIEGEVLYSGCGHEYNMHLQIQRVFPYSRSMERKEHSSQFIDGMVHDG